MKYDKEKQVLFCDNGDEGKAFIHRQVVTTVGMTSQQKRVKDRVVMRRWVWFIWEGAKAPRWYESREALDQPKIGYVLTSRSVRNSKNRMLSDEFIEKHALTDKEVERFKFMFDKTKDELDFLEANGLVEVVDMRKRAQQLTKRYLKELEDCDGLSGKIDEKKLELLEQLKESINELDSVLTKKLYEIHSNKV
ncbi:hypothetical protein ABT56_13165 [Photobacterium aquae]|uniref:Uncharacterized protein n=1 Tax=Photobacterium aquae TaxID=1195763 RepID=A0A0J1GZD3_9GAMM|nr:hypothetical protein [Photobacterium aquae]KLV04983.1 hypothetical protein ABT56_13165 [Photobacterium aquae]